MVLIHAPCRLRAHWVTAADPRRARRGDGVEGYGGGPTDAGVHRTATTLLRFGAFTVLTDPNFLHRGQRAYLGKGLFSKRLTEPSLQPSPLSDFERVWRERGLPGQLRTVGRGVTMPLDGASDGNL